MQNTDSISLWQAPLPTLAGPNALHRLHPSHNPLRLRQTLVLISHTLNQPGTRPPWEQLFPHSELTHFVDLSAHLSEAAVLDLCAQHSRCTAVVGLGDRAAMDSAKVMAAVLRQPERLADLRLQSPPLSSSSLMAASALPLILAPAASAGSEAWDHSFLCDRRQNCLKRYFHPNLVPEWILLDPFLTDLLPTDAMIRACLLSLGRCLEALCLPQKDPFTTALAHACIGTMQRHLHAFWFEPKNLQHQMQLLGACNMSGYASSRGSGIAHALAISLSETETYHHGPACIILFQALLKHELLPLPRSILTLLSSLEPWLQELTTTLVCPSRLRDLGISGDDLSSMLHSYWEHQVSHVRESLNPNLSKKNLRQFLEACY